MRIKVTQHHIDKGGDRKGNWAVALAIQEATLQPQAAGDHSSFAIGTRLVKFTEETQRAILNFLRAPAPFSFFIHYSTPEHRLATLQKLRQKYDKSRNSRRPGPRNYSRGGKMASGIHS